MKIFIHQIIAKNTPTNLIATPVETVSFFHRNTFKNIMDFYCRDNDACFYGLGFGGGILTGVQISIWWYEWIRLFNLPDDWNIVLINHPWQILITAIFMLLPIITGILFRIWLLPVIAFLSAALILANANKKG